MSAPEGPPSAPVSPLHARLERLEGGMLHDPAQVRLELLDVLEGARVVRSLPDEAFALCLLAGCAFFQGNYQDAAQWAEAALDASTRAGLPRLEARCRNGLGLAYQRLGRFDEALEQFTLSLGAAQEQGDDVGRARVLNNIALIHLQTRSYDMAVEISEEARELALAAGQSAYVMDASGNLMEGYFNLGRYPDVLRVAGDIQPTLGGPPMARYECVMSTYAARAHLELEQGAQALTYAQRALAAAQITGDLESLALAHLTLGRAHLSVNEPALARPHLESGLSYSQECSHRPLQAEAYELLSDLHEAEGQYREALEYARAYQRRERALHMRDVDYRVTAITAQARMEVLRREAETERERSAQLAAVNRELRDTQQALAYQATHDALTGLLNRHSFYERLEGALETLGPGECLALLFVDLDRFKEVNDTAGHPTGDRVLTEVGRRLRAALPPGSLLGRISGDEFTVLLRAAPPCAHAGRISAELLAALDEPIEVGGQRFRVSASIGFTVAPEDGLDILELRQQADLAMYYAKRAGGNAAERYQPQMSASERERRDLGRDLRDAVHGEDGQLRLHYQGQHRAQGGELVGFEALARWTHPRLGSIPPDRFIPLAEADLLILDLGRWVLRAACHQAAAWGFEGRGLFMSVNVSAAQFEQPDFVQTVQDALRDAGLPGACLVLELTETMILQDRERSIRHVRELQAHGVHVALDDFGTGYSSLSLLQDLPFLHLKIDRSFVRMLGDDTRPTDRAYLLMQVMVHMAHSLGMSVVAEGVETPGQQALLRDLGCESVQGYLLSRPQPAETAAQALA